MSLWFKALERHKRLVIAHRGARSLAPENTLPAARKAFEAGADGWELDVRLSADLVPMVIHDASLERTSDAGSRFPGQSPWEVDGFDRTFLQELDSGSWFEAADPFGQIAAGEVGPAELAQYRGCPMPTLAQALELTVERDWLVNVELKDHSGRAGHGVAVEMVLEEIRLARAEERVLISSFNPGYLLQAREMIKEAGSGVPLALLLEDQVKDPLSLVREVGASFFHPRGDRVTPDQVAALTRAGVRVQVWTVNQPDLMDPLWKAGAVGVITDFPQLFMETRQ